MGSNRFQNMSEEELALADSWSGMTRLAIGCTVVAVVVWAAVAALRFAVHESTHALFHEVEHERTVAEGALLLVVMVGAAAVRGVLLRWPSWRETAGDGIATALDNFHSTHRDPGDDVSPRFSRPDFGIAARKSVATLLTLGSGASGGLEGPVVLVGEALSSGLARIARVNTEYELRTYQLAAISTAVCTLLGAPFTAALFATEIAYKDRIIYRKFAFALYTALIAYVLNNRVYGFKPLFSAPDHAATYTLAEYAGTAFVAVAVSAPVALGFGYVMTHTKRFVQIDNPVTRAIATAAGAAVVALGLWWGVGLPPSWVLGMGESAIEGVLGHPEEAVAWWLLLLALLGKMVTTGLTIGGGGSAGLLIPSMYLGGISGAMTAQLINSVGGSADPSLFAVVGIASALVAVIGVPLAAIALVLEVFGSSFGPPAILACGLTYVLTVRIHVYQTQRDSPDPAADELG
jgi:CIC family chloride channel protein